MDSSILVKFVKLLVWGKKSKEKHEFLKKNCIFQNYFYQLPVPLPVNYFDAVDSLNYCYCYFVNEALDGYTDYAAAFFDRY